MDYKIVYDPTQFVRQSIDAVIETLLEAVLLVVLVVILFLQTWRASVIPLVAVPVSIIGTFAVLYALGFSINTLSLFGLVLAIGIVVDDSIVVVENVERHIANGLKPLEATKKAMSEVSRPIIAITLVLSAVFIPVAFVPGPHRPVLQAVRADHRRVDDHLGVQLADLVAGAGRRAAQAAWREARRADARHGQGLRPLLRALQPAVRRSPAMRTQRGVTRTVKRAPIATGHLRGPGRPHRARLSCSTPAGFIPQQDKLYLVGVVQLPPAATLERTAEVVRRMGEIAKAEPGVLDSVQFGGVSANGFAAQSSAALVFFPLKDFDEREGLDRRRDRRRTEPEVRVHPGRVHRGVPAAARDRTRHAGRLQAQRGGPREPRRRGVVRRRAGRAAEGLGGPVSWPACSPATRSTCRSSTSTSIASRSSARA